GPWATVGFGCAIGLAALVTTLIVMIIFIVIRMASDSTFNPLQFVSTLGDNGLFLSFSTFASTIVCVGLIALIIKVRRGATISEYLGIRTITRETVFVLLAVSIGLIIVSDSLSFILEKSLNSEWMVTVYSTSVWPVLIWIALVIFAPVFEETFFRGFLFAGFHRSRIGIVGTIVFTALLWSLLHIQYDIYGITTIFVLGILLGIVRFKTGSLWSPLLIHTFVNFIATLQVAININSLVG
ncbi:CPBP family intramembrane glutamic endopeptidase, partial [Chloroflexota bacterium]